MTRTAIEELRRQLTGDLLVAGTPDYDGARRIWNAAIDRHPALIVRCRDVHDIAHSVRFAARHQATLAIRGGGHNAAGFAICDDGVVIDLTRMREVHVDAAKQTARVAGGATFADFDAAAGAAGLACTGPVVSMVGVGGYTLGGGLGWLHRTLGLACDRLVSAQVVTADGQIVEASERSHPDLFWALRGGGGNFGVVSAFEFRLAPIPRVVAGLIFHPLEALPDVAALVREFNHDAPDEVCVWLMMRKAPASPALPTELHGRPVVAIGVCYAGAEATAGGVLGRLRQFGKPLLDNVQPRAYAEWQRALDGAWGDGFGNHWTGHYLPELTDAAAHTLLDAVSRVTSPFTDVKLLTLGGAMARVGEEETAVSFRQSKYALVIQTRWPVPGNAAPHLTWSRALFEAMKPHSTGKVYVNFMPADDGANRIADAYGAPTWQRLRRIKTHYDPHNLFHMNQNIHPA
jgi:FAD/FMN-containing dehydrogenase